MMGNKSGLPGINRPVKGRSRKGSVLLEFVCVTWMFTLAALVGVNCGVLAFAAAINDAACREAVRAAAEQNSPEAARQAASAALSRFSVESPIMSSPQLRQSSEQDFQFQTYAGEDGRTQLNRGPFVRVSTEVRTKMPAPIIFSYAGLTDNLQFVQSYNYPLVQLASR